MRYMLLIYGREDGWSKLTPAEQDGRLAAYRAYSEALAKAGAMVDANRLHPIASTTTVRVSNGRTEVLDGPYADSKEQLGGYFVIDAPDLDAAIAWAARCPGASPGAVEVRPIWTMAG